MFSMWFAYTHFWARNVFSMDPPWDYISGTEPNQIRIERDKTRTRMGGVLGSQGRKVQLKIDCELL
jgi:hypothetical protein